MSPKLELPGTTFQYLNLIFALLKNNKLKGFPAESQALIQLSGEFWKISHSLFQSLEQPLG